jgi:hypothetical protein
LKDISFKNKLTGAACELVLIRNIELKDVIDGKKPPTKRRLFPEKLLIMYLAGKTGTIIVMPKHYD